MIYEYLRIICTNKWTSKTTNVTLRGNDVQGFETKRDDVLLLVKETPNEDVLKSMYKMRLGGSEQFRTIFAMYSQDTVSQHEPANFPRFKNMVKSTWIRRQRIDISMPEMTGPRAEPRSDEKVMTEAKAKTESKVV